MTTQLSTLPNGFRIVTHHIPHVETVSMGVWIGAGSRCETPDNNGIAHFLEHMAFKGTMTRSAFDIVQQIEAVGGDLNAATSQDVTYYHASLLKQDINLGIDILADILQNSTFAQEEIEKERKVVLQEIDQTNDTPDDVIFDHFQSIAFPNQSLGRPILGSRSNVKSFNKKMLRDFIKEHYLPHKMVFAAAGNLNHDEVVARVKEVFLYPKSETKIRNEAGCYKGGYSHIFKKLEQQHFVIGFEGVSLDSKDFYLAHCYSGLLGGGMSSRLFQEIREKRGLVYGISSFVTAYRDTGLFGIYTGTSEDQIEEIIRIIFQEIENSISNITVEEAERAKNQLKAHILMSQESTAYWANTLARQVLTFGKAQTVEEITHKIDAIDKGRLGQYASDLLTSVPSLAFIGPRKKKINYELFGRKIDSQ
jgi:predicted Zn-dependent peptidase